LQSYLIEECPVYFRIHTTPKSIYSRALAVTWNTFFNVGVSGPSRGSGRVACGWSQVCRWIGESWRSRIFRWGWEHCSPGRAHQSHRSKLKGNEILVISRSFLFSSTLVAYLTTLSVSRQVTKNHRHTYHITRNLKFSVKKCTVEPCYKDIDLYDTSSISSDILQYQLIPH